MAELVSRAKRLINIEEEIRILTLTGNELS